ncbi:MAG: cysteine desulfurase family protein [Sulfobacillus sp.]
MHYLDHAATTPLDPRVKDAMLPYLDHAFGNPSSIHRLGQEAKRAVEAARRQVAELVGAKAPEVIFTGSGTEADNLALFGLTEAGGLQGAHVVISAIEHHAVLHAADRLERLGASVCRVAPERDGRLSVDAVLAALRPNTRLVSAMWVNNETGVVQPIAELAAALRQRHILFHTDAVQAAGHLTIRFSDLGVDALSLSAHKLSGPKGVGALVLRSGVPVDPLLVGGAQERSRRAGTENVAGIVGFGQAAALWGSEQSTRQSRLEELSTRLRQGLAAIPGALFHGATAENVGHIVNVRFAGVDGEALLLNLDLADVAASSGSACTSGSLDPSHVLMAMGMDRQEAAGAVRFSLGVTSTEQDVAAAITATAQAVQRLRHLATSRGEVTR